MLKSIKLPNDVVVEYWALQNAVVDFRKNVATVHYSGHVSEDSFLAGKPEVLFQSVEVDISALSEKTGLSVFIENAVMAQLDAQAKA